MIKTDIEQQVCACVCVFLFVYYFFTSFFFRMISRLHTSLTKKNGKPSSGRVCVCVCEKGGGGGGESERKKKKQCHSDAEKV